MTERIHVRCPNDPQHQVFLANATQEDLVLVDEHGDHIDTIDTINYRHSDPSEWKCHACKAEAVEVKPTETERLINKVKALVAAADIDREPDVLCAALLALLAPKAESKPAPARREIYVLSYAPSYDRCGVGGFDWHWKPDDLVKDFSGWFTGRKDDEFVSLDYRMLTLRFPEGTTEDQIRDFMDSPEALNLVDPPDPSNELIMSFNAWKAKEAKEGGA